MPASSISGSNAATAAAISRTSGARVPEIAPNKWDAFSIKKLPEARSKGAGKALLGRVEEQACTWGVKALQLHSTATGEEFFARQGYRVIERGTAPRDMQGSEEFRSLCPSSATCMAKSLPDST